MAATTLQAVYSSAIAKMTANVLMMPLWCGTGPAAVPRFGYRFRPKAPEARSPRTDPAENGQFGVDGHHCRAECGDMSPCNAGGRGNFAKRARKSRLGYASAKDRCLLWRPALPGCQYLARKARLPVLTDAAGSRLVGIGYLSARGSLRQPAWEPILARRVWSRHVRNG